MNSTTFSSLLPALSDACASSNSSGFQQALNSTLPLESSSFPWPSSNLTSDHIQQLMCSIFDSLIEATGENKQGVFGPQWAKGLNVASFVIVETVGNGLLLFLVWYERSTYQELTRTLVTQLWASAAGLQILFNMTFGVTHLLISLEVYPQTELWCLLNLFLAKTRVTIIYYSVMAGDVISYLYKFVWRNVGYVNDYFWGRFLTCHMVMMSTYYGVIGPLLHDDYTQDPKLLMCMGASVEEVDEAADPGGLGFKIIAAVALFVHFGVYAKTFAALRDDSTQWWKTAWKMAISILMLVVLVGCLLGPKTVMSQMDDKSSHLYHLMVIWPHTFYSVVISVFFPLIVIGSNEKMRVAFVKTFKDFKDFVRE